MKDDLLREATRALRETTDVGPAATEGTRARVLATLRERRKRRLELLRLVLPLAAILIASTGWAATTGRLHRFATALGFGARPGEVLAAPANRAAPALAQAASVVVASTVAPTLEPGAALVPSDPASLRSDPAPLRSDPAPLAEPGVVVTPPAAGSGAPSASTAASSGASPGRHGGPQDSAEVHALYTAAHRSHFVDRSWPAALAGWNAYLAAAPRGQFAAEAQYNRALCLVRLGRDGEARTALEVFARGGYGAYRRSEAQAVLDAMGAPATDGRSP